jgi:hypothetical protein
MGMQRVPLVAIRNHLATVILALQYAKRLCPDPKDRRVPDLGLSGAQSLGRLLGTGHVGVRRSLRES